MPDAKPYFTVKVTRCPECPDLQRHDLMCQRAEHPYWLGGGRKLFDENVQGITPSCPMWAQRVSETPKG